MVSERIIIAGIVGVTAVVIFIIISRSRCRELSIGGENGIRIQRDTSQEHDINLSELRSIVPGIGHVVNSV
jgi:hypothetical protein